MPTLLLLVLLAGALAGLLIFLAEFLLPSGLMKKPLQELHGFPAWQLGSILLTSYVLLGLALTSLLALAWLAFAPTTGPASFSQPLQLGGAQQIGWLVAVTGLLVAWVLRACTQLLRRNLHLSN